MKRFISVLSMAVAVLGLLLVTDRKAWGYSGYVDPGTGLLALQCASSVALAGLYYMRRRIRSLFSRRKKDVAVEPTAAAKKAESPKAA